MSDVKRNSGIGPEADAALRERSREFAAATQRKGLPTTWGVGRELREDLKPQPKAKKGKR